MTQPDRTDTDRPLVSSATILILSGYLIGMTVGKFIPDDLSPFVFATGVCGFLSFVALELNAERRRESAVKAEENRLNERLNRHVDVMNTSSISGEPCANAEQPVA